MTGKVLEEEWRLFELPDLNHLNLSSRVVNPLLENMLLMVREVIF